jgi:hypothetical protein
MSALGRKADMAFALQMRADKADVFQWCQTFLLHRACYFAEPSA